VDDPLLSCTAGWGFESPRQLPKTQVTGRHPSLAWPDVIPMSVCLDGRTSSGSEAGVIRKCGGSLQVQGSPAATPHRPQTPAESPDPRQTKSAWPEAKKVEAQLPKQLDRGEQHCSRTRTVGEQVERWLEWHQQVRSISPVTVANYRGAIDRSISRAPSSRRWGGAGPPTTRPGWRRRRPPASPSRPRPAMEVLDELAAAAVSGWPARCWSWPRSCAPAAPNPSSPKTKGFAR
jgi:hypothetical protein